MPDVGSRSATPVAPMVCPDRIFRRTFPLGYQRLLGQTVSSLVLADEGYAHHLQKPFRFTIVLRRGDYCHLEAPDAVDAVVFYLREYDLLPYSYAEIALPVEAAAGYSVEVPYPGQRYVEQPVQEIMQTRLIVVRRDISIGKTACRRYGLGMQGFENGTHVIGLRKNIQYPRCTASAGTRNKAWRCFGIRFHA